VFHAGQTEATAAHPWLGSVYFTLLVIGGINTAFSAFYYVRVLKVMVLDRSLEDVEGREPAPLRVPAAATAYAGVMAAAVVGLGVAWNEVAVASEQGVQSFAKAVPAPVTTTVAPAERVRPGGRDRPKAGPPKGKAKAADGRDE
jgi:hypothetical protein